MALSIMLPVSPANALQQKNHKVVVKIHKVTQKEITKKKKKTVVKEKKRASRATLKRVAQGYALRTMKSKYNWSKRQFVCLSYIWNHESHWQFDARNKSSGALGIPQAYPGHKMRSAGKDYKTNYKTQIDWGLNYIKRRYGTPCGAYHYRKRHGYY